MDGFTADYLANLTAALTERVLEAAGRRVREAFAGTEAEQALRRCVRAGTLTLLAKASAEVPEDTALLETIFRDFFDDLFVARELSKLLRGRAPDRDELCDLFEQAGYDAETLPGLDFKAGMAAFEAGFVEAALAEPALQDRIQAGALLEQTQLQRALLGEVRTLVKRLQSEAWGRVGIRAGTIRAENVVNGVQVVHQWGQSRAFPLTPQFGESLRARYLTEVARSANRLPWTVVEQEYAHPERGEALGLAEVYTALDTTELERVEREEDLRRFLAEVARDETRRVPAQAMADREARLVVLGDPGSGKSTFTKHLAYILAKAGLADDPAPWLERLDPWRHGVLLPVRVELRALAAYAESKDLTKSELLLGYVHQHLKDQKLDDVWPQLNAAIRDEEQALMVLLDGLDEVPLGLRWRVVGAVQDFADRYDRHRYVVTCRPYAYVGQPCQIRAFKEVTLAPFSEEQIDQFVGTWYRELARRERLAPQKAKTQSEQMQRAVKRPDLRGLAQRPLLLTVMTLLHTFRGQLPQDRTELYADAVDLLLRRWEGRIGADEGILERLNIPDLKMSDLEAGLYAVAFHAHSEAAKDDDADGMATADVDEGDLRKWLAPYLGGDWNKAGAFVDYISERAGLLIRHKTEAYTFPHRTFQEFMAACHLVGLEDYPGAAARLTRSDFARWREVFVLAGGHAARIHRLVQAISAVNALCPMDVRWGEQPDAAAYRRAQLAGEALLEIGLLGVRREEAGHAVLVRVRNWLQAALRADEVLKPTERAQAGIVLAKLGDPRAGVGLRDDGLPDVVWCPVPAGPFLMGSTDADEMAYEDEKPQHTYEIEQPYAIGKYPITNAQYDAFVEAGGYGEARYWPRAAQQAVWSEGQVKGRNEYEPREAAYDFGEPFNVSNHPAVGVTWYEAVAFCRWLTEVMRARGELTADQAVRLPTEPQWEKAARGVDGRVYPWGGKPDPERANYGDTGISTTSAVGAFPGGASPYNVEEMSGNVWEWCRTKWASEYEVYRPDNDLEGSAARVLRGGAFRNSRYRVRCAFRYRDLPNNRSNFNLGFRVVVSPCL